MNKIGNRCSVPTYTGKHPYQSTADYRHEPLDKKGVGHFHTMGHPIAICTKCGVLYAVQPEETKEG